VTTTRTAVSDRRLTPGWADDTEPLGEDSTFALDPTGCLDVTVKLRSASPDARYTVGLNVYGADLPELGGVRRAAFAPGPVAIGDGRRAEVNEYRLGSVRTDDRGDATYHRILSVAPGAYEAQVWVARRGAAAAACFHSGRGFGDAESVVVAEGPDVGRYLRMRKRPRAVRGARRVAATAYEALVAGPDLARLCRAVPELADHESLLRDARARLMPDRNEYITTVSSDIMTVSLETAALLRVLCETRAPRRIVDLGSGFSSFVVRQYAAEASPAPEVWSVDDSPDWLGRTCEYLAAHGLPRDRVSTWPAFADAPAGSFDLVLHDLGAPRTRMTALPIALRLAAPEGGIVVIDDMHKAVYRPYARRVVRESGLRYFSARRLTRDHFGRYAAVATH
jgi:predicted O-methyltransferase YrrM